MLRVMRRRLPWIIGGGIGILLVAIALLTFFVFLPGGSTTAEAAILDRVEENADPSSAKVLVNREWGDGRLILAGYGRGEERRLALGFVIEQSRGWRLVAYTEETVETTDVVVGSLLIASSEGGTGQPAWSAAAGELADRRIAKVEIRWASGESTTAARQDNAYLVLEEGTTTPLEARYLMEDGTEVAKVPIEG